ncbi:MAG: hypothetical protein RML12_02560 [Xanthomonadales bacterium]|nr:hypothetical protein [Xanthomonadales bacterium]
MCSVAVSVPSSRRPTQAALAEGLRGFEAASLGASHLRRRVAMARLGERGAFEPGPWQFVPEPPPAVREDFQAYADWLQHPRAITGRPRPSASLPWAHGAVAFDLALLMPPPVFGRGRAAGRLFGLAAAALNPELCAFEFPWTLARPERTPSNWLVTEPLGREEELLAAWVRRAGEALHPERPADRAALLGELLEGSAAMAEARLRRELEEFRLQRLTRPLPAITARLLATPKGGPWREGLEAVLRRVSQALLESDRCLLPAAWIEPEAARALLRRYARALAAQRRAHERALERRPLARLLAGA